MDNSKKRRFYDSDVKAKIIRYAEEHGNRAAGRAFDIPESCIRLWRKCQGEGPSSSAPQSPSPTVNLVPSLTMKPGKHVAVQYDVWSKQLEDALCEYIRELRKEKSPIPLELVQLRAQDIAMSLNLSQDQFDGTRDWVRKFMRKKKYSLYCKISTALKMTPEYEKKLAKYRHFITQLRKQNTYPLSQIGNANEIPVFLDLPSSSNKGFTVMLCVTADGGKLPPFIVFKCDSVLKKNFPTDLIIRTQESGCMTQELMLDWYRIVWNCRPGVEFNPRALLTLDSSISHLLTEDWLTGGNTDLVVVPNSTTSLPQPVNTHINNIFKEKFREQCEKWLQSRGRLRSASPSLLSYWISAAWRAVPKDVIINSFKNCFLSNSLVDDSDDIRPCLGEEYVVSADEDEISTLSDGENSASENLSSKEDTAALQGEAGTSTTPVAEVVLSGTEENEEPIPLTFTAEENRAEDPLDVGTSNDDSNMSEMVDIVRVKQEVKKEINIEEHGVTPAITTVRVTPTITSGVTPTVTKVGVTPSIATGVTPTITTTGVTPAIATAGVAPITVAGVTPAITMAGVTPITVAGVTPAISTAGVRMQDRQQLTAGRRVVVPQQENQVMLVVHNGNLMLLHSALQVPITPSQ